MATQIIKKTVCDVDVAHKGPIDSYRVSVEGHLRTLELCPACAKPIIELWKRSSKGAGRRKPRVYQMNEIAQKKTRT